MAKNIIKGKDLGLYVEKTAGSGQFTRVMCTGSIGITLTTDSDDVDCVDSGDWAESEPGQHSWEGSADLTTRQLTDAPAAAGPPAVPAQTDATDGVSMENLVDYQIQKRKILVRMTLGAGIGAARYSGLAYITKSDLKGQTKGNGTGSISLKGTGPLTKTLATTADAGN